MINMLKNKSFIGYLFVAFISCVLFICMGYVLRSAMSISSWYMLGLGIVIAISIEYLSWRCFFIDQIDTFFGKTTPSLLCKLLLFSIISAFFLEALTSFGSIAASLTDLATWNKKRIIIFFGLVYLVSFLTIRFAPNDLKERIMKRCKDLSWKTALFKLAVFCVLGIIAWIVGLFLSGGDDRKAVYALFAFLALCSVALVYWNRKKARQHPERLFLAIALPFGIAIALIMPPQTGNSWDDQIHYANSVALSYVVDPVHTDADLTLNNPLILNEDSGVDRPGVVEWSVESIVDYAGQLDDIYTWASFYIDGTYIQSSAASLGYIPSAIGIWIARMFHLPFSIILVNGRLFNLLFYCVICFFAIKITPIKKILFSFIALLPTFIFLAANYSYDPWVISLLMLSLSLFIKEYLNKDSSIKTQSWIIMIVVALIAIAPKAIYFPIFALFLLLPKSKFKDKKSYQVYVLTVCAFMLIAVFSFIIPYFASSSIDVGDARVNSDVNPRQQLMGILSDPIRYAGVLINFYIDLYMPIGGFDYSFSYLNYGFLTAKADFLFLPLILVVIFSILDSNNKSIQISNKKIIGVTWGIYFVTIILIATALYIDFTSVGSNTIDGCQERYMFPLFAPLFALGLNFHISSNMNYKTLALVSTSISALFLFVGVWNGVLLHFVS